jgi:cytochrome bd ubiquinol oxidase subunit II
VSLPELWFIIVAFFWAGYFLLEGFDFGVGALLPFLGRTENDRRAMFDSIGPLWDGNEVWLVVAGGATFAAFPAWYAASFSGFYLALLLVLLLLIIRLVSFEWRSKSESPRWRAVWQWVNTVASVGAPFIWGVALANFLRGLPLDAQGDFTGNVLDLFSPYTVFAGLAVVLLFAFHGASFLTLRTTGELCDRAAHSARTLGIPAALGAGAFVAWTVALGVDVNDKDLFPPILPAALCFGALALAAALAFARRSGWSFAMTALGTAMLVATLFTSLYPRVLVSRPEFANSLTIENASSSHYALKVMTVAAVILTPVVLLYQAWTYYVFRARVGGEQPASSPVEALARKAGDEPAG